jgi:hypothetical protein
VSIGKDALTIICFSCMRTISLVRFFFASCYHHATWMIFRQNLFCSDITLTNWFNQFTTGFMWTFIMSPWHLGLYFLSCTRRNSILLSSRVIETLRFIIWQKSTSKDLKLLVPLLEFNKQSLVSFGVYTLLKCVY